MAHWFGAGRRGKAPAVFVLLAVFLLLSGCATRPPLAEHELAAAWRAHQQSLAGLDNWAFGARLGFKDAQGESWNAALTWRQTGESFDIRLSSAFGQGAVRLSGRQDYAVIETAEQAALSATSAEALMEEQLGWSVPVQGLKYWLIGLPAPELAAQQVLDQNGRLATLQQSGWVIRYGSYSRVEGVDLPRKLELENPRLRARLVIDRWRFGQESGT